MPITEGICNSFKQELLVGTHNMDTDGFKLALYTSAANIGPTSTVYTTTGEVSSANYTAGGKVVDLLTPSLVGGVAFTGPANGTTLSWTSVTIPSLGGTLLYNTSKSNKAVVVHSLGTPQNISSGTLIISFPDTNASTGLIKLI